MKPPVAHRWESERADHLYKGSEQGTSRRRRCQQLAREARRAGRAGAGVSAGQADGDITPALWRRRKRDESIGTWGHVGFFFVTGVGIALAGGAIALGNGVYWALERWVAPRVGRLWMWPWAALGVAALLLGALSGWLPGPGLLPGALAGWTWQAGWIKWQLVVTPLVVAWLIHAWGWAGVPKGAVPRSDRNADGSFRVVSDKEKVKLDPLAGAEEVEAEAATEKPTDTEPAERAPDPAPEKIRLDPVGDDGDVDTDDEASPSLDDLFGEPGQWREEPTDPIDDELAADALNYEEKGR
ncbi:MAG: hypothetical protein QM658_03445 [Gordonia sp. (in: high G+C Gram-positive bacteria)]